MTMPAQLAWESTLASLPCHHVRVSPEVPGQAIARELEQKPDLPGVLITEGSVLLGMLSRRKFLERMSQPYSLELYSKRPVRVLLKVIQAEPLQLSSTCRINTAAQTALRRPHDLVYEPILVLFEDESFGLLDFQTLLLAQSRILGLLNNELIQQRAKTQQYVGSLQREQQRVQQYTHLLEKQQAEIQGRNQLLEAQQAELLKQSAQISALNQRFIQIGQLLATEGQRAFQATFAGSENICRNTGQIVAIGDRLTKQLDKVQEASKLIENVSRQVRHLSVQAAIVANQSGSEISGFSHIASEIGQLVNQAYEAGQQVEAVVGDFRFGIQDLTRAASEGTTIAQSLSRQIRQAETALGELEQLVQSQGPIEADKRDNGNQE